jgi:hypothetical protein
LKTITLSISELLNITENQSYNFLVVICSREY